MYRPIEESLTMEDERAIRRSVRWIAKRLDLHDWKYKGCRIERTISVDSISPGCPQVRIATEGNRRTGFVIVGGARLPYRKNMGAEIYDSAARQLEFIKCCQFHGVAT